MANSLNYFHHDIDDFNNCYAEINDNKLRILQWNVRGLNDMHKFDSVLQILEMCKFSIDVIVFGETWISSSNSSLYKVPGYVSCFSCRNQSNGGLAVFVKNSLSQKVIKNDCQDGFHHIHVEVEVRGICYDIHGLYRPPSYDFVDFNVKLENVIESSNCNRCCLIVGDVNVPVNNASNNAVVRYKTLLESYGFVCSNTFVTRPASGNILDHVICKLDDIGRMRNDTIENDISDHSIIITSLNLPSKKQNILLKKRIINHRLLESEFQNFLTNIGDLDDVDNCLENIIDKYNSLLNNCTRTVSKKANVKSIFCPWMSFDLWTLIKLKNNYLKRVKRNPSDNHLKEMLQHVSRKVEATKKRCKQQYYESLLNNTPHSRFWKNLKQILGNEPSQNKIELSYQGRKVSDNLDISNIFNNYFSSIGNNLAANITSSSNFPSSIGRRVSDSIYLHPASVNEILLVIRDLENNKACGPDNIPVKIVKNNADTFAVLLQNMFNSIIETGTYPNCLKVAKVIPIFKSGDSNDVGNYRPISTLSVFNKVFEKLLVTRILDFFHKHDVLYKLQYGFRQGCSTLIAITELVDSILNELDNRKIVGALFLDLKKAFDTLNHEILLKKLEMYGIRGVANNIIRSYLENRKQFVSINGVQSSQKPINIGVPQGSNIGPILFLAYINDLGNLRLHGIPRLFADDSALFYPGSNSETIMRQMEEDLQILLAYFNTNLLSLNLSKTKLLFFHSPRKKIVYNSNVRIGTNIIERVDYFKYLGIFLDTTLSWKNHINHVEKKVASLCGIMRRISTFVTRRALLSFYYAYIHSQLNYLVSIWGRACISNLKKLQVLQNRCLKIMFKRPFLYPTLMLYSDRSHNILPLVALCDLQTHQLVFDVLHRTVMHHNIQFPLVVNIYGTRQANNLQRVRATTSFAQKRIRFIGPMNFNQLPVDLKQLTNRNTFRLKLKVYMKSQLTENQL